MRRTREFDRFGPWIDVVREPDDVPRLFRSHPLDLDAADLVLKVPRPIPRRDATPDMDLYDHLAVVDAEATTLLTRRGTTYTTAQVRHRDVAAVHTSVDLLDGRLRLLGTDREPDRSPVAFRYSSVSQDLVESLVRAVRARVHGRDISAPAPGARHRAAQPAWGTPITLGLRDLGDDDVALVTLQRDLTEHEHDVVPVASHLRRVVRRVPGRFHGLLDAVRPVTLHAAVVLTGPGELHVLHRREWVTTGRGPLTSVATTTVLTGRVTGMTTQPSDRYEGVDVVRLDSGRCRTRLPMPVGSETEDAVRGVVAAAGH